MLRDLFQAMLIAIAYEAECFKENWMSEQKYAGFWIRTVAAMIDTILVLMVVMPIHTFIYGQEYWVDNE
ncbi:MAG: hypothetical protein ACI9SC_000015 [Gammaproteobacteria bacterium]